LKSYVDDPPLIVLRSILKHAYRIISKIEKAPSYLPAREDSEKVPPIYGSRSPEQAV
jgi:hypothetical protein